MLPIVLFILTILAVFVIARIVFGVNAWAFIRWRSKPAPTVETSAFIEATAALMVKDERVATAVYNQLQRLDAQDSYGLGLISFLGSMIAIAQGISDKNLSIGTLIFCTALAVATMWALGRLEKKLDTYRQVIERYQQMIALPPYLP